jgi:hypothetical protein
MDRARFPGTFEFSSAEPPPRALYAPRNICAGNPPGVGLRIGPRHFTVPLVMHAPRWVTLGLLLLNQCAGQGHDTVTRPTLRHPAPPAPAPLAGLPAVVLAQVPPGTQGPVVAHFDDRSLAIWARTVDSSWQFQSVVVRPASNRVESSINLGQAPVNLELLFVKALPSHDSLLAYTHLNDDGAHHLTIQVLDAAGKRRSGPTELASSSETLQWLDVAPTSNGPIIFWATRRGDRADVRAAALAADGTVRVSARDVVSDLRAWQVTPYANGAALATVRAVENKANGAVSVTLLDGTAAIIGKAISLTRGDSAELDVDVVPVGDNCVVAWTDHLTGDSRLHAAAINVTGQVVTAAYPLTAPLGDQSLAKLVTPRNQGKAYILWENLLSPSPVRRLQLAAIDDKAQLGAERLSIAYPALADRVPEVVSTTSGLALLSQAPASLLRSMAAPISIGEPTEDDESQQVPIFAAISNKLTVTGIEPLLVASRPKIPNLAWGLECRNNACFTLSALSTESEAAVLGISLSVTDRASRCLRASANDVGSYRAAPGDPFDDKLRKWIFEDTVAALRPKLSAVRVVSDGGPLADLAVARGSDVPWVSTLTYSDAERRSTPQRAQAEDGRHDAQQARIELRGPLGEANVAAGSASINARSAGGLAWAIAPDAKDKILAYSALDQKIPQLFAARFDKSGKKTAQKQITHRNGDISAITATAVPNGYFIGWIDDRPTTSTALFARLTRALDRKGPEQTISKVASTKTDLKLLARGDEVWAVWSDTRESNERRGDIFLLRLAQTDGHELAAEQRLFETPAHSHSPQLSAYHSGVIVGFMETEPREAQPEGIASVRVARLDAAGHPSVMRQVQVSRGVPASFGIDCAGDTCRLAVAVDVGGTGQIEVATLDPQASGTIHTTALIRSLGPADESVSPVIVGNDVYWVDRGTGKRVRVMRAAVEW